MKLIFFLITFFLVGIRYYFSWSGKEREKRGLSVSNMVIKADNFYEEINYSGKFQLSDDETYFRNISPGGYFKFQKNNIKIKAESNLRGEIEYTISDGKNRLPFDGQGKLLVAQAIREMINWGYDGDARMERVYKKGGHEALLKETDSMRTDQLKVVYLKRLFAIDSLSPDNLPFIIGKIGSLHSGQDKVHLLSGISARQLGTPSSSSAYFKVLEGMGSDMDKTAAVQRLIDQDSVSEENIDRILGLTAGFGSDVDKSNFFQKMIAKGLITGSHYDSLVLLIASIGSDLDKVNLYKKMIEQKTVSEIQWLSLMNGISRLGSDMDKSSLLVEVSHKMPRTEITKANYFKAAKTIHDDYNYGKAVRAVD
jgi:hypothetical protein